MIVVVFAHSAVNSNKPDFGVSANYPVVFGGIQYFQRTDTKVEGINCGMP